MYRYIYIYIYFYIHILIYVYSYVYKLNIEERLTEALMASNFCFFFCVTHLRKYLQMFDLRTEMRP